MKLLILLLSSLLFSTQAYADCMTVPDKQVQVKIDTISSPVFDGRGNELRGCLLHSDGKILGYSRDDGLCHLSPVQNVKVRLSYGCCDTGPDDGDTECIVRSQPVSGTSAAHGNGVNVNPVALIKKQ